MTRVVLRRPGGVFGLAVLGLLVVGGVVSYWWTPFDPRAADPARAWLPPLREGHLLGTDRIGRDQFSQLLAGAGGTLVAAVASAAVAAVVGVALALAAVLAPRPLRASAVGLIDVLVAFPTLLLAMVLSAVYGSSLATVVAAIGIGFGVGVARVTRAELLSVLGSDYVLAARASGARTGRIVRRHLLPNVAPTLVVQLSLVMALAVLAEAALTYLGYGASPSSPSWGGMLHEQQAHLAARPLLVIWPGVAVAVTVLGCNLLGDALRDAGDPRAVAAR
ncbi:ABC transporter permease [Saccharothrix obliqua]|uniref:ABC transporter permease n=1 Tax=Saccharothrix obliqua TaxID=2861747 RepID=UPI001C5F7855|nr:ABC transporter permease [Saccharothrix obliqua]MBW4718428.1 ABC transporter permease [Saccharothrix obliqua]